jgi:hypothetical protein
MKAPAQTASAYENAGIRIRPGLRSDLDIPPAERDMLGEPK